MVHTCHPCKSYSHKADSISCQAAAQYNLNFPHNLPHGFVVPPLQHATSPNSSGKRGAACQASRSGRVQGINATQWCPLVNKCKCPELRR